jgi:lactoylglutathione lyase
MKLDHINFTVQDVAKVSAFLKKHFGYKDAFDDNNDNITGLGDDSGMHILLMKGKNASYPKMFHIGFNLGTQANVDAMFERLTADGLDIKPPENLWGSWSFHFTCPGGEFVIEVACTAWQ